MKDIDNFDRNFNSLKLFEAGEPAKTGNQPAPCLAANGFSPSPGAGPILASEEELCRNPLIGTRAVSEKKICIPLKPALRAS